MIPGLLIASIALIATAIAKMWKFGPFLEQTVEPVLTASTPQTPEYTTPAPTTPPSPVSSPTATLFNLCRAMRDFEGAPGDANYINNNPLNCRYSPVGYLPKYQPVHKSPNGFAIFKDYSTGWLYGFEMLKHKIQNHPDWTLYDLINSHAPSSDANDPSHYADVVAKKLGVDKSFKVKKIMLV